MFSLLTVLINPVPGREEDFNSWYTDLHIREVLRFAGVSRMQRLVATPQQIAPPSHKYFAMYDTLDPALLSLEHKKAMGTPRMVVTSLHDKTTVQNGYYNAVAARTNDPELLTADTQPVILEQLDIAPDQASACERVYVDERLPTLVKAPGHISGVFLRFAKKGQMFEHTPKYSHMAVYRVSDLDTALKAWRDKEPTLPGITKRAVSCYTPMMPYLSREAVAQSSPEELEVERRAHERASRHTASTEDLGLKWT